MISLLVLASSKAVAQDGAIKLPSGLAATFYEMIWNHPGQGLTYRFRFVAPEIAAHDERPDPETMEADMAHLCQEFALPRISEFGPQPNQVVISISDRPTVFGVAELDAVQFFEGYSIAERSCIWEPF